MLNIIQKHRNLVRIQTDDALLMNFRHINQDCRIGADHLTFEIIGIKTAECRDFPLQSSLTVCLQLISVLINLQIFLILLQIDGFHLVKNINGKIREFHPFKCRIFTEQEFKEDPDIISIGDPRLS